MPWRMRRRVGAALMIVGGVVAVCVAGSGLIDSPRARVLALLATVLACGCFVGGIALISGQEASG